MNYLNAIQYLNEYTTCRKCGSEKLGNGEGAVEITENTFKRTCKCGWGVEIVEEDES